MEGAVGMDVAIKEQKVLVMEVFWILTINANILEVTLSYGSTRHYH